MVNRSLLVYLLLVGVACKTEETKVVWDTASGPGIGEIDRDQDGFTSVNDCDDADPETYPGAPELCDGRNNDCDAAVDEEPVDGRPFNQDADLDGYGNPDILVNACERSPGFVEDGTDCDDTSAEAHPGAAEICNDGLDNDCDGDLAECSRSGSFALEDADIDIQGVSGGDRSGGAVAAVGDMNGDGLGEIAVAGTGADTAGGDAGAIWILGALSSGVRSLGTADHMYSGSLAGSNAGSALAAPGDIDGDGFADLLIGGAGAELGGIDSGGAWLVLGPGTDFSNLADASGRFIGEYAYDGAGGSVGWTGDATGDGVVDLLIGAIGYGDGGFQNQGAAYLVSGTDRGEVDLRDARGRIEGEARMDRLGAAVSGAGDHDGDGLHDLLIGAPSYPANLGNGAIYLALSPIEGRVSAVDLAAAWMGEAEAHAAGSSVSSGDVNGDGYSDLVTGAPGADLGETDQGAVYVVFGGGSPSGMGSLAGADLKIVGEASGDALGQVVDAHTDADGDGVWDVWMGAPGQDRAARDAGAAGLLYGGPVGALSFADVDFRVYGVEDGDAAGSSLSMAGDLNGDRIPDLIVGGPGRDPAGDASGGAWVVFGQGL